MANRTGFSNTKLKAQRPIYEKNSKMKKYKIIYDEEIGQMRTGFMNFLSYVPDLEVDKIWKIGPGFVHRTDLISKKFYGTSIYDWVIEQVNGIRDPIKDVTAGRKIIIPAKENIYDML